MAPFDRWTVLLLAVVLLHLAAAPYTKVEESFNMQATHDMLFHKMKLVAYDHHEFPGVVPRTFTGAALLSLLSWPWVEALQAVEAPKLYAQYVVRGMLGLLSVVSLGRLRRAIDTRFGRVAGRWWMLLAACQFHPMFYASRLLPNSLAAVVTNWGLAEWLANRHPDAVVFLFAFATAVVRADMLLLSGLVGLQMLLCGSITLKQGLGWGVAAVCCSLAATIPFDSLLWGRWLWPEGEVLWFNTVQNKWVLLPPRRSPGHAHLRGRGLQPLCLDVPVYEVKGDPPPNIYGRPICRSSEWGTMPWHWYWTSALPRALLGGFLLVPLGLVLDSRARTPGFVAMCFVCIYSFLPHKELRFLLPVFPLFNLVAAAGLAKLQLRAFPVSKNDGHRTSMFIKAVMLLAAAAATVGGLLSLMFLRASQLNYPGGVALYRLHEAHPACAAGPVHIGTLAAMTGVSRFGQLGDEWKYSKVEDIPVDELQLHGFSCLLSAEDSVPGFEVLEEIESFERVSLAWRPRQFLQAMSTPALPVKWHTVPKLYIMAAQRA